VIVYSIIHHPRPQININKRQHVPRAFEHIASYAKGYKQITNSHLISRKSVESSDGELFSLNTKLAQSSMVSGDAQKTLPENNIVPDGSIILFYLVTARNCTKTRNTNLTI